MRLLEVENLKVHFPLASGQSVRAVDGVSFSVDEGASFGIVGESGSGKSTTAQALMRLVDPVEGAMRLGDHNLSGLQGESLRLARKTIQMVFQDPFSSLNPRLRAGQAVREPLDLMGIGTKAEREAKVDEMFAAVGLHPDAKRLFPHQFSGGQRQRLCIARAMVTEPRVVVCDEPVSALDVAIQAQILNLLKGLQRDKKLTYVFISHDLAVVQNICTHVAVMYLGEFVETGPVAEIFANAKHPYTWSLMAAALSPDDRDRDRDRFTVSGEPPSPINPPKGCRFAGRCPFAQNICVTKRPELTKVAGKHRVACHFSETLTPPLAELAAKQRPKNKVTSTPGTPP
ncbi:ABC transporter ATP-binding protein [Antarcticimicrobium sediminis]|uniref:ABC transporter ATP-binding protein n=1 Tax=Antarcticimicrobium sediminis TaxID=2546227 RepID=A0A4R5ELY0_9RHOB|nr:ABC transporter ATP-binding protein [Antarcticimicrobium sediminis]TDE35552.1 ABC transporter ATP-binding protein [Antarcticimicrobium sediminis]